MLWWIGGGWLIFSVLVVVIGGAIRRKMRPKPTPPPKPEPDWVVDWLEDICTRAKVPMPIVRSHRPTELGHEFYVLITEWCERGGRPMTVAAWCAYASLLRDVAGIGCSYVAANADENHGGLATVEFQGIRLQKYVPPLRCHHPKCTEPATRHVLLTLAGEVDECAVAICAAHAESLDRHVIVDMHAITEQCGIERHWMPGVDGAASYCQATICTEPDCLAEAEWHLWAKVLDADGAVVDVRSLLCSEHLQTDIEEGVFVAVHDVGEHCDGEHVEWLPETATEQSHCRPIDGRRAATTTPAARAELPSIVAPVFAPPTVVLASDSNADEPLASRRIGEWTPDSEPLSPQVILHLDPREGSEVAATRPPPDPATRRPPGANPGTSADRLWTVLMGAGVPLRRGVLAEAAQCSPTTLDKHLNAWRDLGLVRTVAGTWRIAEEYTASTSLPRDGEREATDGE